MKRIIAITLLLCLLLYFAAPALAQTRPLRFLINDNGEAAAWLKEHYPEIPSQNLHSDYDYSPGEYDSLTDRLLGELEAVANVLHHDDGKSFYAPLIRFGGLSIAGK